MAAVKSLSDTASKWSTRTQSATSEYETGVKNPKTDWATATANAETSYKTGVTQAASEGRFSKGVKSAGTAKWQDGVTTKGITRWGSGVAVGETAYSEGVQPYLNALSSMTLPARGATGDARNIQRVQKVVDTMLATKKAQS